MAILLSVLPIAHATAQSPVSQEWDADRAVLAREDLIDLVERLSQVAESPTYSHALRERARDEAAIVQARLDLGDFDVGEQIELVVEGEDGLTDTFTVRDGRILRLPVIGDIDLRGVLRGELEEHLTNHLARFIREPSVSARSLSHIAILGEVLNPGFYVVGSEVLLADAIMLAGGPAPGASLDRMRIERAGTSIWDGEALQTALAEGRTIDRMSLRAGDQIVIPGPPTRTFGSVLQSFATTIPAFLTLYLTLSSLSGE